jgi:hypothetical protein
VGLEGGDNFQGINPPLLAQLMKSLSSGVNGAQPTASGYVGRFSRLGLDTGPVNKLLADYSWATSQSPMLQRRYSLASHQPSGDFTGGWTSEGAGVLTYSTTAAAQKAGAADAKQLQAYLDNRDWTGIQKELTAMSNNTGDSDYMAALFSKLGPTALYQLSLYTDEGNSDSTRNEVKVVVGNGLAAASYEMNLTNKFLQGIAPPNPPAGYSTAEMPGGWDTGALANFLTQGEFSKQWLQTISPAVLYQEGVTMGQQLPPGYDSIFQAIAHNPDYAASFYKDNSDQLTRYMTEPPLYNELANDKGFGQFIESATIPPYDASDTKPFTANATAFVRLFGSPTDFTSPVVRQAMAAVAMNYFGDLSGTVTAAAPDAGSTMGLSSGEWGGFVQNAMEDKTGAAALLTFYANWKGQQPLDNVANNGQGDGPDTPGHAGYWNDQSLGALDYFFASNYQAAGAKAGDSSSSVKSILLDALDAGGATLLTSVAFGPEAGAVELLADAGKDAFSSATESTLGKLTEPLADSGGSGNPGADKLAAQLTGVQARWSSLANTTWQESGSQPGKVSAKSIPPVYYNGVQYNGDPLPYEQQYGGSFLDSSGTVKPIDDIAKDPKALAAYNAWLKDPAISNAIGPQFSSQSQGSLNGQYANSFGGGGG